MPAAVKFRPYSPADLAACLALFDLNCPEFFAPNERADYEEFLRAAPAGYEVCVDGNQIVGAFGVLVTNARADLRWIHLAPDRQGKGVGSAMIAHAIAATRRSGLAQLHIAASDRSAPFFARFGARQVEFITDGWGPGMHRVTQILPINSPETLGS